MLGWRKELLEDLIKQSEQPTDGPVNPALSQWINEAKVYARDKLNIEELKKGARGKCCPDIEAGLVIDKKMGELNALIEKGHQKFQATGCWQPEIDIIGSTVEQVKSDIWQRVSQVEEAGTICIHGIAGVGKTAIAAAINNQALKAPERFDFVIWVDVSDGANLWRVQEDIASVISEKLPADPNTANRAAKLRIALTGKKKFLLILDSMWQGYSPSDIGIPELTGGRKLIVTSRIHSVLALMGKETPFVITPLNNEDAWTLFKRELGTDNLLKLSDEILSRTNIALQDLQGVSLAIKDLAQTLKNICQKNPRSPIDAEWKEELKCLSRSANFPEKRIRDLFSLLEKSYHNLRAETQPCFLFCALYPKACHIEIKELIDYWMWEGLLGSGSLEEMRSNGKQRLNDLLDTRLLEIASEVGKKVKMLNVIRDMALAKASKELFVRAGNNLADFPVVGASPEGVVRMSFVGNQLGILVLPGTYKFDILFTLLLQDNAFALDGRKSSIFAFMPKLRVLDLSNTRLSILPESLFDLTNLRSLLLRNCRHLSVLPSLSKLENLNALNLSGTKLEEWPEDMHKLTSLRCLDLTQAKLDIFPAECIRSYKQLEELLMLSDINSKGCVWGSNELGDRNGAHVDWLPRLTNLADLQLVFLNAMVFTSYMNTRLNIANGYAIAATCFKFFVGAVHSASVESNSHENSVTMIGGHRIMLPENTSVLNLMNCANDMTSLNVAGCLRDLTVLDVFGFNGLTYLLTLDMWHSLGNLRKICVRRCRNMVGIIQPAEEANPGVISHPSLVELVLFDLKNLQRVHDGEVLNCENLTRIGVWRCRLLRLPELLGVRGENVIEIEGEREWQDAFQQHNPGFFDRCPVRFMEAPIPPEVSYSPRFTKVSNTFLSSPSNDTEQEILMDIRWLFVQLLDE
ncbi:hypothetical protein Ancab_004905 [Ancistrocladus abbreviatus]